MKQFFYILLLLNIYKLNSQVTVNGINKQNHELLRNATTYFVVPEFDTDNLNEYKRMLNDVWTFNKLTVITSKEASKIDFKDENNARIAFSTVNYYQLGSTSISFRDIQLHYNLYIKNVLFLAAFVRFKTKTDEVLDQFGLVKNNAYYIYSLGVLKNCMQQLNASLLARKPIGTNQFEKPTKEEVIKISSDTVFIPDYIKKHCDSDINSLLSNATFKTKLISSEELNKKILNCKKSFYYLVLNSKAGNVSKFVDIVDAFNGKCVFNYWEQYVSLFNEKDIKRLNKFFGNN